MEIREIKESEFAQFYKELERDFPSNERPPYFVMKKNLKNKVYDGIYLTDNGKDVGYAIITPATDLQFALITFLAILPDLRSCGYGSEFLKAIEKRWHDRILVIEAEDPAAIKNIPERELRERRIVFYEKAGYRVVPTKTAKIFGVKMKIMVKTTDDIGSIRAIMHAVYLPALKNKSWLRNINIKD